MKDDWTKDIYEKEEQRRKDSNNVVINMHEALLAREKKDRKEKKEEEGGEKEIILKTLRKLHETLFSCGLETKTGTLETLAMFYDTISSTILSEIMEDESEDGKMFWKMIKKETTRLQIKLFNNMAEKFDLNMTAMAARKEGE